MYVILWVAVVGGGFWLLKRRIGGRPLQEATDNPVRDRDMKQFKLLVILIVAAICLYFIAHQYIQSRP